VVLGTEQCIAAVIYPEMLIYFVDDINTHKEKYR
jgi:hypothetical protein